MDITHARDQIEIEADAFTWMTVHGNLCLGLRHPNNTGPSRKIVENFVEALEAMLVKSGLLSEEDVVSIHQVERQQSPHA